MQGIPPKMGDGIRLVEYANEAYPELPLGMPLVPAGPFTLPGLSLRQLVGDLARDPTEFSA